MYQAGQLKQINDRVFYAIGGGGTANTNMTTVPWIIPREARFVCFVVIGPGGGGAGGSTGTAGTFRTGGGGGGCGSITSAIYPARMLSEMVYITLSPGGTGGGASGNGSTGTISQVSAAPNASLSNAGNTYAVAFAGTFGLSSGSAGSNGAASTIANSGLALRAVSFQSIQLSVTGGAGGNPGVSTSLGGLISAGAGGGGIATTTPTNGGSILTNNVTNIFFTNLATSFLVQGGLAAGGLDGGSGHDNILGSRPFGSSVLPWYALGGAGGASIDSGTGGNGGAGAIGCGGGGGGAGTTGGRGGPGGPGFCWIEWW